MEWNPQQIGVAKLLQAGADPQAVIAKGFSKTTVSRVANAIEGELKKCGNRNISRGVDLKDKISLTTRSQNNEMCLVKVTRFQSIPEVMTNRVSKALIIYCDRPNHSVQFSPWVAKRSGNATCSNLSPISKDRKAMISYMREHKLVAESVGSLKFFGKSDNGFLFK